MNLDLKPYAPAAVERASMSLFQFKESDGWTILRAVLQDRIQHHGNTIDGPITQDNRVLAHARGCREGLREVEQVINKIIEEGDKLRHERRNS